MIYFVGDIVMLKELDKYKCSLHSKQNLYKIQKVEKDAYFLDHIDEKVNAIDILPVPVDRIHDLPIYYFYYIAGNMSFDYNDPIFSTPTKSDTRYYMDAIKEMDSELYKQVEKLAYVHEVQRILKTRSNVYHELKINGKDI